MNSATTRRPIPSGTTGTIPPQFEAMWPDAYLESFVNVGDPLADKVIQLLYAEGRADADPIASNATAEGREQNRRIEVVLHRQD